MRDASLFSKASTTTNALPVSSTKRRLLMLGPAFIAAIGYIDPGNFATNIESGSAFGYQLLWVVLWANLMAMLIQYLSAKLGIRYWEKSCRTSSGTSPQQSSGLFLLDSGGNYRHCYRSGGVYWCGCWFPAGLWHQPDGRGDDYRRGHHLDIDAQQKGTKATGNRYWCLLLLVAMIYIAELFLHNRPELIFLRDC